MTLGAMERIRTEDVVEPTEENVEEVDGIFTTSVESKSARLWIAVLTVFAIALSLDVIVTMIYIFVEEPPVSIEGSMRTATIVSVKLNNATLPKWKPLPDRQQTLTKIAFGSCSSQEMPQPYWDTVTNYAPDLFILAGDNVYGDCAEETCQHLRQAYKDMAQHVSVQGAAPNLPVFPTLDDHDYGSSDCDGSNPYKDIARELFAEFFGIPPTEFDGKDGVYRSKMWGPLHQRLQIILLDTRYDRSPFQQTGIKSSPYTPIVASFNSTKSATTANTTLRMLSEKQWDWLEKQIQQPANLGQLSPSTQ